MPFQEPAAQGRGGDRERRPRAKGRDSSREHIWEEMGLAG